MWCSGWRSLAGLLMAMALFLGCAVPPSAAQPPLSAAAAQATLDGWNPSYCKVAEFYGIYKHEAGNTQVAYVSLLNPSNQAQKPIIYAASFQLLTRPNGKEQWYLTGLVTHGSGILTKRQGWDNLLIPLQEAASAKK